MNFLYVLLPVLIFGASFTGSIITSNGMAWYDTLHLPSFTPAGGIIGIVWTILFILLAIGMILIVRNGKKETTRLPLVVFGINILLNVLWTVLFFGIHEIGFAFFEALLLAFSVIVLMKVSWNTSRTATYLFLPYVLWVLFASYLTYSIWMLN